MKRILILFLLSFQVNADTDWSACTDLMQAMASDDVSDETGSISTAYSCETSEVMVVAKVYPHISSAAVIAASPSFIDNYCLNISKGYMLADPTGKNWLEVVFKGGITYIVSHPKIDDLVYKKTFDECLTYAQDIKGHLPEDSYEQVKFIRQYQLNKEVK